MTDSGGRDHADEAARRRDGALGRGLARLPIVTSLIALMFGGLSFWNSYVGRKDAAESDAIRKAYDTFLEFDRTQLQQPELSHLFAMPDEYPAVCRQVIIAVGQLLPSQRAMLLLRERVVADYIFTMYETTLYQRRQAGNAGDRQRAAFLEDVRNYLTRGLLRNPRLLYYWAADGVGLISQYDKMTVDDYTRGVLHDADAPLTSVPDQTGPFGAGAADRAPGEANRDSCASGPQPAAER